MATTIMEYEAAQVEKAKAGEDREKRWRDWAAVAVYIIDCRHERQIEANEALLPSAEKMGSSRKLEPWTNRCSVKLPPPP